jgi:hypothetical protein
MVRKSSPVGLFDGIETARQGKRVGKRSKNRVSKDTSAAAKQKTKGRCEMHILESKD